LVTNEQLYLIVTIPMLSNAAVALLGVTFLEMRSGARDKRSKVTCDIPLRMEEDSDARLRRIERG